MEEESGSKNVLLSVDDVNRKDAEALCKWLTESNGYIEAKILPDGSVAGLMNLLFTRAICLGCGWEGWTTRFCFEDKPLANERFKTLASEMDIPAGHVASRNFKTVAVNALKSTG